MIDLLVRGGLVVDGTGGPARHADVAVHDGVITMVDKEIRQPARRVVDAAGRVVCPGFIDVHGHSDLAILSNPAAHSKVRQGVTTEVVGNCGLGAAPLGDGVDLAGLRAAIGFIDLDPDVAFGWTGFGGFLDALDTARPAVNVAALVGHVPLRSAVLGFAARRADSAALAGMCGLLADALDAGALGLSTGLVYAPICYADEDELLTLARVVAERDRIFTWHVRDYADGLLGSVEEAIRVAEATGCRTQISHLAAVGRRNHGAVRTALDLIDAARDRGALITADVYPYLAGSANLSQLLPGWAHDGGVDAMRARLRDADVRRRIHREWADRHWDTADIVVSSAPGAAAALSGRGLDEIAAERAADPGDVLLDLVADLGNAVAMVAFGRSEDDLWAALSHPAVVIGSDGFALDPDGVTGVGTPHPRSYGCYPRLLDRYVGAGKLTIEQAVHKCTGLPATVFRIPGRGTLATGMAADIVVFDPAEIADRSTFTAPHRFPAGIDAVVVNGSVVVVAGSAHTTARPGQVLRALGQNGRMT